MEYNSFSPVKMLVVVVAVVLVCALHLGAQSEAANGMAGSEPLIPETVLEFTLDSDMPHAPEMHLFTNETSCTGDGTFFFTSFDVPQFIPKGPGKVTFSIVSEDGKIRYIIYSVSVKNGVHSFRPHLANRPGLFDIDMNTPRFFVTEKEVYFLMTATKDSTVKEIEFTGNDGTRSKTKQYTGEHKDFMIVFDREGSFRRTVEVDSRIAVTGFGVFESGKFLVNGADRLTNRTVLAVLDEGGAITRVIDKPTHLALRRSLPSNDGSKGKPEKDLSDEQALAEPSVLKSAKYVATTRGLLLVPERSATVYEVDEAGFGRAVNVEVPKNLHLERLLPSDGRNWIVEFCDPSENGKTHSGNLDFRNLHEVDPETGKLVRRFVVGRINPAVIGCFHNGSFLALNGGSNGDMVGYKAQIN